MSLKHLNWWVNPGHVFGNPLSPWQAVPGQMDVQRLEPGATVGVP